VLAPNPGPMTLDGTNTYVVGDGAGQVVVIDPGPEAEPAHLAAILRTAEPLGQIQAVLVTHRHLDHLPAAEPLCQQTGAVLVGHRELPGVQRGLADGEAAFGTYLALETPGHTSDSLCFWDPGTGTLFTGDLIAGRGTVVVDEQRGALRDYLASLERLAGLEVRTIYPGHGPRVDDGAAKIQDYLSHRRQRVQQVVDALARRGRASVPELVSDIYPGLAANLLGPAARNVSANLDLLHDQGRARAQPDSTWQLT
jgi:glyoxylase-like metal-dependent hydrolase (beta-lactamase superfamily II)